jgi:hypothetical protein
MEYSQDRLRAQIRKLEDKMDRMSEQFELRQREALVGEIVVCVVMFFIGMLCGWVIAT